MKRLISYRIVPYFMLLPTIAILAFVVIYPMVFSFWISLHRWYLGKPLAFPFVGLRNYSLVLLRDPVFRTSLTNTLTLAVLCIPLELALGISLAILLSREDIRGKGVFGSLIVMPVVLTPIVSGVLWKFQFHPSYGLVNFLLGLLGI
ncbi:MAG: carbohydrate ABC transporter permease [Candidatus Caldatribacteriaceae bacterium]